MREMLDKQTNAFRQKMQLLICRLEVLLMAPVGTTVGIELPNQQQALAKTRSRNHECRQLVEQINTR
jgi:hypothetical protein